MPLTDIAIKNLKPKEKLYRVADNGGLCIEVTTKGAKLWRWRYYYNGKQQMLSLGKYPRISLGQARKLRDAARDQLDEGLHPAREKKAAKLRRQIEGANTFKVIAENWYELRKGNMDEKYRKQCLARMKQHVFPLIGNFPITQITIPDVVNVVEKIGKRGTVETAKRMKQQISAVFRYASQRGMCPYNPAADLKGILPRREEKHHAAVKVEDFPKFWTTLNRYNGNQLTKLAMQLLAHTFVRTGELIGAKWSEINWDKREWHIPKERMKRRRPHLVPLSEQAITILKAIQSLTGGKEYIFHSSVSKSKHMSNGTFLMALRRMKYDGKMTGHGFRTIASTILNEKRYDADVIERQLAHEDEDRIRSAYNRAEYLPERKKMMQDYSNILDTMINPDADILKFAKRN